MTRIIVNIRCSGSFIFFEPSKETSKARTLTTMRKHLTGVDNLSALDTIGSFDDEDPDFYVTGVFSVGVNTQAFEELLTESMVRIMAALGSLTSFTTDIEVAKPVVSDFNSWTQRARKVILKLYKEHQPKGKQLHVAA